MVTRELTKGITRDITRGIIQPFNYFIFTVKTDNAGTSLTDQFTVPTVSGGTYDAYVDWGDGSAIENITTYNDARWTHTFAGGAGTYTVKIYGVLTGFVFNNANDKLKILNISQFGILNVGNNPTAGPFNVCQNLTITATDAMDVTGLTTIYRLYRNCFSLVDLPNATNLVNANITDMFEAFENTQVNPDISSWDTRSVTRINRAFKGNDAFDRNMAHFNVESVVSAIGFMENCDGLSTDNYDATLISWASQNLNNSISIDFGGSKWGFGYGGQARYDIISTYAWTIADNGKKDSTLSAWLNAHNILGTTANPVDGTAVSSWKDLSGNTLDGDATGPQMPTFKTNVANGEPGILFDGLENRLDIADTAPIQDIFNSATGGFCIAVFKAPTEGEVIGRVWSKNASDGSSIGNVLFLNDAGVTGKMDIFWQKDFSTNQGRWQAVDGIDKNEVMIVMYHYSGADVANDPTMYINSKTPFSLTESQTPIGTVKSDIGFPLNIGNANGTTRTFDGHIFELAFFKDKNPTTQEISDYFDYLSTKYGVTLV